MRWSSGRVSVQGAADPMSIQIYFCCRTNAPGEQAVVFIDPLQLSPQVYASQMKDKTVYQQFLRS